MKILHDTLAGKPLTFYYIERVADLAQYRKFVKNNRVLALDTESTHFNCYRVGWQLRTFQCGNASTCYVLPARFKRAIAWTMRQAIEWIAHNGPHDIRCIDRHLGYDTGVVCAHETFIHAHHIDSRNKEENGRGHGLKELACYHISAKAGKWAVALKAEFKKLRVLLPGEYYKAGPRKGQQKTRPAHLDEGWSLIDPTNAAYIAYAAADPVLTYCIWEVFHPRTLHFSTLYVFDHAVQQACDVLHRRAIKLDVEYTRSLSAAFLTEASTLQRRAAAYGLHNIHSGAQIANVLSMLGCRIRARTPTGKPRTNDKTLRRLAERSNDADVQELIHLVLGAKQLIKRNESYALSCLREMDSEGRVHPSIKVLAARTARMSISNPPLQQLPTKDRSADL